MRIQRHVVDEVVMLRMLYHTVRVFMQRPTDEDHANILGIMRMIDAYYVNAPEVEA